MSLDFIVNTNYLLENGKKYSAKRFERKVKQKSVGEFMLEKYIELGSTHEEAMEMEYENYISGLDITSKRKSSKVKESLAAVHQTDIDKYKGLYGWINYPITREGDEYLYFMIEKALASDDSGRKLIFDFINDYQITGETVTRMRRSMEAAFFENDESFTFRTKYGVMNIDMVYESFFNMNEMHLPHIISLLGFSNNVYLRPKGKHLKEVNMFVSMMETIDKPEEREFFSYNIPDVSEFVSINQFNRFFMVLYNAFVLDRTVLIDI